MRKSFYLDIPQFSTVGVLQDQSQPHQNIEGFMLQVLTPKCDMTPPNSVQITDAASYLFYFFRLKRITAESLFKIGKVLKKPGKATGQTPCSIHLLQLFTYRNSKQMSHVTDKPQKASGMLLLSI